MALLNLFNYLNLSKKALIIRQINTIKSMVTYPPRTWCLRVRLMTCWLGVRIMSKQGGMPTYELLHL